MMEEDDEGVEEGEVEAEEPEEEVKKCFQVLTNTTLNKLEFLLLNKNQLVL